VLLTPFASVLSFIGIALIGIEVYALVDALVRPSAAFVAAGKLTKPIWAAILAVAVVFTGFLSFLGLAGIIATLVYLYDVRPALRRTSGRSW
jgi:hypothetical protein